MKPILIFIILNFITSVLSAQPFNTEANGIISNDDNKAVSGVTVILRSAEHGEVYKTVSNSKGIFHFQEIKPADDYSIEVFTNKNDHIIENNIIINLGQPINIFIDIQKKSIVINSNKTKPIEYENVDSRLSFHLNNNSRITSKYTGKQKYSILNGLDGMYSVLSINGVEISDLMGSNMHLNYLSNIGKSVYTDYAKGLISINNNRGGNTTKGSISGLYSTGGNHNKSYGGEFSLSAPIIKNRLFIALDVDVKSTSISSNVDESFDKALNLLSDKGYNTSDFFNRKQDFNLINISGRIDANLSLKHNLTLTALTSINDFNKPLSFGTRQKNNLTVISATVQSNFIPALSNTLSIGGYATKKYNKTDSDITLPSVAIKDESIIFGSDYIIGDSELKQTKFYLKDNFRWNKGANTLMLSADINFNKIDGKDSYGLNGCYSFNDIYDFTEKRNALSYFHNSISDNSTPLFSMTELDFNITLENNIILNNNLTLNFGFDLSSRMINTSYTDSSSDEDNDKNLGNIILSNDWNDVYRKSVNNYNDIKSRLSIYPFISFDYTPKKSSGLYCNGSVAFYEGDMPYLNILESSTWNNGGRITNIFNEYTDNDIIIFDPTIKPIGLYKNRFQREYLFNKELKTPYRINFNLNLSKSIGKNTNVSLWADYNYFLNDITYTNLSVSREPVSFFSSTGDKRGVHHYSTSEYDKQYKNILYADNINGGYSYNLGILLDKKWSNSFYTKAEYNFNKTCRNPQFGATSFDLWSSTVGLNKKNNLSNHKIVFVASYRNTPLNFSINACYKAQSGYKYSYITSGSPFISGLNEDIFNSIYIPINKEDIHLTDVKRNNGTTYSASEQWNDLDMFISKNDVLSSHRGEVAPINSGKTSWNHQLDINITKDFLIKRDQSLKGKLSITAEIVNFANLLNRNWGHLSVPQINEAGQGVNTILSFRGYDADKTAVYSVNENAIKDTNDCYCKSYIKYRHWQLQLKLKYAF